MELEVKEYAHASLIQPKGALDRAGCTELESALNELLRHTPSNLILDLSQLESITSAGLRVIVAAFKSARRAKGDLSLVAPEGSVREVLEFTGLDTLLHVYATCEAAIRSY